MKQANPTRKEVDMHIHSHYSDGDCSIEELIKRIRQANLKAAVLTDHDTIDGQDQFISLCKKHGIDTTTGIEISTTERIFLNPSLLKSDIINLELHILGYGFDMKKIRTIEHNFASNKFAKTSIPLDYNQIARNHHLRDMMNLYAKKETMNVSFIELTKRFNIPWPLISRYWLIKYRAENLLENSEAENWQTAKIQAQKEMSDGGKFFPFRKFISPEDAINLITSSGGIAVLAHPMHSLNKLQRHLGNNAEKIFLNLIAEFKEIGLTGIEVYAERHTEKEIKSLRKYCEKYNLIPSFGGSDYHGDKPQENSPGIHLGKGGVKYSQFLKTKKV